MIKNERLFTERLTVFERIADIGRTALDCIIRGMPTIVGLPESETKHHSIRVQIEELQTIANDPKEHEI